MGRKSRRSTSTGDVEGSESREFSAGKWVAEESYRVVPENINVVLESVKKQNEDLKRQLEELTEKLKSVNFTSSASDAHTKYTRIHNSSEAEGSINTELPNYCGKEKWRVYYNRFEQVATRARWTEDEKLDVLLPRLQGAAGEFVFDQLSAEIRNDYNGLIRELNSRFRVVESNHAYQAKFNEKVQEAHESVEDYASELRRLYTKAYPMRGGEIRSEDLMHRFFEGLADEDARFHVEYVKCPSGIDEAVYEVVNLQETKGKSVNGSKFDNGSNVRMAVPEKSLDQYDKLLNKVEKLYELHNGSFEESESENEEEEEEDYHMGERAAMLNSGFSLNRRCYICDELDHLARNCPNKGVSIACQICWEKGHDAVICPDRNKGNPNY